jgi:predicted acetyltransferase
MRDQSSRIKLIEPTLDLKTEFLDLVDEHQKAGEAYFDPELPQLAFSDYLRDLAKQAQGIDLPPGIIPMTTYWLVAPDRIILGISVLRHELTPALEHHGGHIGYLIRPSQRRQGYGTLILALTLEKARDRGIQRVRITCDADNIGSVRIIENNGGVLSGQVTSERSGKIISQYWVAL